MLTLLPLVMLAASTSSAQGSLAFAKTAQGWTGIDRACRSAQGLAFVSTPDAAGNQSLMALDPATGEARPLVELGPLPPARWEGAAGSSFLMAQRPTRDGKGTVDWDELLSNYWQDWLSMLRITQPTAKEGHLLAACPGGRVVAQCLTAKRTVEVVLEGDLNDDIAGEFTLGYRAFAAQGAQTLEGRETLHIPKGKLERARGKLSMTFVNKRYRYVLETSTDATAPSATLSVYKGSKLLQAEPCAEYLVVPSEPEEWLQQHHVKLKR